MADEPGDFYYQSSFHDDPYGTVFDPSSYMGFTDCFNGTSPSVDYNTAFGLSPSSPEALSQVNDYQKSTVVDAGDFFCGGRDTPTTPNSSVSSASNETAPADDSGKGKKDDGGESSKKGNNKLKKKGEKKEKEARFAFMTKSEVDHLEDGYRWRKYGQKAVKNSPFPRSYYRCTTQKCAVKKRVERSFQDPTVVITTYEGQHNHPLPSTMRGSMGGMYPSSLLSSSPAMAAANYPTMYNQHSGMSPFYPQTSNIGTQFHHHQLHHPNDYGLLQDVVPSMFFKQEP